MQILVKGVRLPMRTPLHAHFESRISLIILRISTGRYGFWMNPRTPELRISAKEIFV
jgi:hypothetical protein